VCVCVCVGTIMSIFHSSECSQAANKYLYLQAVVIRDNLEVILWFTYQWASLLLHWCSASWCSTFEIWSVNSLELINLSTYKTSTISENNR